MLTGSKGYIKKLHSVTITLGFVTPNFIKLDAVFIGVSRGWVQRVIVTPRTSPFKMALLNNEKKYLYE